MKVNVSSPNHFANFFARSFAYSFVMSSSIAISYTPVYPGISGRDYTNAISPDSNNAYRNNCVFRIFPHGAFGSLFSFFFKFHFSSTSPNPVALYLFLSTSFASSFSFTKQSQIFFAHSASCPARSSKSHRPSNVIENSTFPLTG